MIGPSLKTPEMVAESKHGAEPLGTQVPVSLTVLRVLTSLTRTLWANTSTTGLNRGAPDTVKGQPPEVPEAHAARSHCSAGVPLKTPVNLCNIPASSPTIIESVL